LVLVNGLAEQPETWCANVDVWRRHFDVHAPTLAAYAGEWLHERIESHGAIDVEFLVDRLRAYLTFIERPPYDLLANSMGGKVAVEFAVRHPALVRRLVLLCPSGLACEERLPLVEGVRRGDPRGMIESVFSDARRVESSLVEHYRQRFADRRWRTGLLRTIRGTMDHRVRELLRRLQQPTLVLVGAQDRIVDPRESIEAARQLPRGRVVVLDPCGHAPQIERAETVNPLVVDFLQSESLDAFDAARRWKLAHLKG
jgi:pimeloyl-ACP methyl ester carboxylesterase